MRSKLTQALEPILNSFVVNKLLPGILIGLFAYAVAAPEGEAPGSFLLCMVVFWAAIGLGHALSDLATRYLGNTE